jgi:hypothetical protein
MSSNRPSLRPQDLKLTSRLGEDHADLAVDVVYGGQPLYPNLFGVE